MKRFLSILLAVMLIGGVLPTVFATEGEVEAVATEGKYYFYTATAAVEPEYVNTKDPNVWDSSIKPSSTVMAVKDYGTHGWKFIDVDAKSRENVVNCSRSLQISTAYTRFWSTCSDSTHAISHDTGAKLALAVEKPSTVPSFYKVSFFPGQIAGDKKLNLFMSKYDSAKNSVDDYILPENQIGGNIGSNKTHELSELIYNDGVNNLVAGFHVGPTSTCELDILTLTPVEVTNVTLISTKTALLPEETARIKINATLADGKVMPISHSFITYESSNKEILTVSADGVMTAVANGKATVTVKTGTFTKTVNITVGQKQYRIGSDFVDKTEEGVWDSTITNADRKGTIIPLIGYGSHGYKDFDTDDWTDNIVNSNVRFLHFQIDHMRLFSTNGGSTNPDSTKLALSLEAPNVAGFYTVQCLLSGSDGAGDLTLYMTNADSEKENVEAYVTPQNMLNNTYNTGGATGRIMDKLVYSDSQKDLMLAFTMVGVTRINAVLLTPQSSITGITLKAPETVFLGETGEAKVFGEGTSLAVGNGFVTYESSEKGVATIDECGKITPVAEGKTTITATVGEFTKSVELEVIKEDEELKGAFDYTEDEFTSAPLSTATVNTFVAKLGESADKDNAVLTSATANLGESFTVEAPAAEEGYKFLYWAKGMSTDKKQIVSYAESYSFIPTVENTYLIAVYEPISGESSVNKAEFYNANGQLIETLTANGAAPALPEMAGYENCQGWALYGTNDVIAAGDSVEVSGMKVYVAKFGNPKTVKVNEKDVAYGEKVSFTAEPAIGQIFKCWKKDGVIVSTDETYEFYAWKDSTTVEAVYVTEGFTFTGIARKILIDSFSAGNKTALMAEFIGFEDAVEKGIMLGDKRYAMTTDASQFTIVNDVEATEIKGYAIFKDGTIVYDN